ncbi:MAG: polysaccharide biosynthesis tyrosine autokinase [Pyrinomonadaceae bacterium]|nr:polysaccharide biosynthesis tyrosine autokinase [Pyrinomonadaceae bacterium]MBP6212778.1 polysaccharide biosynthesis tyrosine autokinase [Pyrinomonadaceae bacterium]
MKETRGIIKPPTSESTEIERPFEAAVSLPGRYPAYRDGGAAEGFQILDYWRAIRKRLWLIIGITVLITTLTAIYMARKPNIYQARAVVQVDMEQTNPDLVTSDRARPVVNTDPSYFNTQLQLLWSESLIRRVIKEHNLDANKEFQQAKNEGSVSAWRSILKSIGLASDDAAKSPGSTELSANSTLATSDEIAEAVRLTPYVELVRKNLGIEPVREARATVKDTRLIEISFRGTNPELAAFVVNGIAETFTNQNQEKRSGTSRKTNDFLQERIANLQSEIKSDEEKLVNLTQREGILKTDGETTLVIERLSGLNKALLDAENERKNAEANYVTVSNNPERIKALAEQEMARFITEQENTIRLQQSDLQKKIADLRQSRELRLQEYQEGAAEIKEIDVQIKSYEDSIDKLLARFRTDLDNFRQRTTKTILENLKTTYLRAKDREDKIRADFNKQYNEAQGQNQGAVSLKILQQTIDTNKGFLENLRKQMSGNDVAAQGTDNNISVTEIAIPPDTAISPRRLTTVAAAMFLATLFGMGLALFLEYLDDTIRSTEEIENYLQLPALAAIPTFDAMPKRRLALVGADELEQERQNSELLIYADSRSALAEAYRQLRTSILLSTAGHAPKSLLITSSLPSEGKTTTATNTAISLAQTGAKVLIIDADMRRPRLHQVFNIGNGEGLSTLLSSELSDAETLAVIKQDPGTKLHLLTSGPVPPNPAELIGSTQMSDLLKILSREFTHVVIDSPPIASFTDGVLIASMVDGVILVVHAGKSSRQIIRRSRQLLQDVGAKIFGVVLNNANLRAQDNYYYYQSYYRSNNEGQADEE